MGQALRMGTRVRLGRGARGVVGQEGEAVEAQVDAEGLQVAGQCREGVRRRIRRRRGRARAAAVRDDQRVVRVQAAQVAEVRGIAGRAARQADERRLAGDLPQHPVVQFSCVV
ncbi:hypothetical protein GCM10020000_50460 [Streptomyces olivoverticillatus]